MKSFFQILFWGYVLSTETFILGEFPSQAFPQRAKIVACKQKIGGVFLTDKCTKGIGGSGVPSQYFDGKMEKVVASAKDSGARCTCDVLTHLLFWCEWCQLEKYQPTKKEIPSDSFPCHDLTNINLVFLFVNFFFFCFFVFWGFSRCPKTLTPLDEIEMSEAV